MFVAFYSSIFEYLLQTDFPNAFMCINLVYLIFFRGQRIKIEFLYRFCKQDYKFIGGKCYEILIRPSANSISLLNVWYILLFLIHICFAFSLFLQIGESETLPFLKIENEFFSFKITITILQNTCSPPLQLPQK